MDYGKRLRVGQYLVFPRSADPTTDKTALFRVMGFDKLGRPRIRKRPLQGCRDRVVSVQKWQYRYYRVVGKENSLPVGELTDCMAALEAYWRQYPEDREKQVGR